MLSDQRDPLDAASTGRLADDACSRDPAAWRVSAQLSDLETRYVKRLASD
jgi:hypothetical protein